MPITSKDVPRPIPARVVIEQSPIPKNRVFSSFAGLQSFKWVAS